MYTIVGKNPTVNGELEIIECSDKKELYRRIAHYECDEYVVLSKCKVLKKVHDTVIKSINNDRE